jgi:hypothetical protein
MQSPLETPVQALRNTRFVEGICAMDRTTNSISPDDLYARIGFESAPIIVDVRRDADTLVTDAFHRSPKNLEK